MEIRISPRLHDFFAELEKNYKIQNRVFAFRDIEEKQNVPLVKENVYVMKLISLKLEEKQFLICRFTNCKLNRILQKIRIKRI